MTGGEMRARTWREILLVLAFCLAVTVPFTSRPFHMDDAGFLELAHVRQNDPLALTIPDYTFFGQQNDSFLDTHPPLISSYLALLISLTGTESELPLHIGFLVFPLIAAVSMYFIARRYTRHAMLAAMLLMATPGMMVMSHGLMSDVPGVSFWLAGVALFIYGLEQRSLALMALCALTITIGVFISYQVLSVIPLLLAYAVARRQFSPLSVLPFLLPLGSFIGFSICQWSVIGALPRFSYGVGEPLAWYSLVQKGAGAMLALAGASIFFGFLVHVLVPLKKDSLAYLAFAGPVWVVIVFQYLTGRYSAAASLLMIAFLPLGMLLLYRVIVEGWLHFRGEWRLNRERMADDLLLILWLSGVLFYVVVLLPYSSVRYLLPLFAPLILVLFRMAEKKFGKSEQLLKKVLSIGVTATALLGLLIAYADYELASAFRQFAAREAVEIGQKTHSDGGRVWFVGEFGFRYYMEQQGFPELPRDSVLPDGDVIIQSPLTDPRPFSEEFKDRLQLVEVIGYPAVLPLRVTNFAAEAGFYGHFWGLLPFSASSGNLEDFRIYRVTARV